MEEQTNLQKMTEEISNKLLDTKYILDVLEELTECDPRENILISQARERVESSFLTVENCRRLIANID